MVGLDDPHTIEAITNQFYEGAICLHATKQTLNTFFWQAVPNRSPKHLEPPQPPEKSRRAQVGNSSSFSPRRFHFVPTKIAAHWHDEAAAPIIVKRNANGGRYRHTHSLATRLVDSRRYRQILEK
jgi:hypothetical protein